MDKKIIEKLRQDEHYYGDYGKQFLSNSDIHILLKDPRRLREDKPKSTAMVIGGYFHTAILEPDKLESFKIIKSSTRNTKQYKEMSGGEICLLQHEVDKIELMREAIMDNKICGDLIMGTSGKMNEDQLKKAVEFVKGGGAITAIESKYTVTPEQMKTLKNGVNG